MASGIAPETLFARFHDLFFEPGTWLFAEGDLLIALFPPFYWGVSAFAWAAGVVLVGWAVLALSSAVGRRARPDEHKDV